MNHSEIIARHKAGESITSLAKAYGVSRRTIGRVINPDIRARDKDKARAVKWYYDREKRAIIDKRYRAKRREKLT